MKNILFNSSVSFRLRKCYHRLRSSFLDHDATGHILSRVESFFLGEKELAQILAGLIHSIIDLKEYIEERSKQFGREFLKAKEKSCGVRADHLNEVDCSKSIHELALMFFKGSALSPECEVISELGRKIVIGPYFVWSKHAHFRILQSLGPEYISSKCCYDDRRSKLKVVQYFRLSDDETRCGRNVFSIGEFYLKMTKEDFLSKRLDTWFDPKMQEEDYEPIIHHDSSCNLLLDKIVMKKILEKLTSMRQELFARLERSDEFQKTLLSIEQHKAMFLPICSTLGFDFEGGEALFENLLNFELVNIEIPFVNVNNIKIKFTKKV